MKFLGIKKNKKGIEMEAVGKLLLWLFILLVIMGVIISIKAKLSDTSGSFEFLRFF